MNDVRKQARDAADRISTTASADKAKGRTNEVVGKAKAKVGELIGDRELQVKGEAQKSEGKAQRIKGEVKEAIDDAKDLVRAGIEVAKEKVAELRNKK